VSHSSRWEVPALRTYADFTHSVVGTAFLITFHSSRPASVIGSESPQV